MYEGGVRSRSGRGRRRGRRRHGALSPSLSLSLALCPAMSVPAEKSREEVVRRAAGVDGVVVVMHVGYIK